LARDDDSEQIAEGGKACGVKLIGGHVVAVHAVRDRAPIVTFLRIADD
jgi:hypothetical protein